MPVMQAVVVLYARHRTRRVPHSNIVSPADTSSLITVASVCNEWSQIFFDRNYKRRSRRQIRQMIINQVGLQT